MREPPRPQTTQDEINVWRDSLERDLDEGESTSAAWARCYGRQVVDALQYYFLYQRPKKEERTLLLEATELNFKLKQLIDKMRDSEEVDQRWLNTAQKSLTSGMTALLRATLSED